MLLIYRFYLYRVKVLIYETQKQGDHEFSLFLTLQICCVYVFKTFKMKEFLTQNKWFSYPYLALLLICSCFLAFFTKAEIHIFINQFHAPFFDVFFRYLTCMGDGIFIPVYFLILIMVRYRYAILLVIAFLLSGLLVQILKRGFFADVVRPTEYLKDVYSLYIVPGVTQHCCKSFPSGHTATAFSVMVCFALAFKSNAVKTLSLVLACLIAFSRVYLSQHFLIDIFAGSIIGVLVSVYSHYFFKRVQNKWIDNNLLNFFCRKNK